MTDQGPPPGNEPAGASSEPAPADAATAAAPPPPPAAAPVRAVKATKATKATKAVAPTKSAAAPPPGAAKKGPVRGLAKKAPPRPVDDAAAATRGIAVIVVTVVIGFVIFFAGALKNNEPVVTSSPTTTAPFNVPTTDRNTPPPVTKPGQGTTVVPKTATTKVPPDKTKVRVTNGVDPSKTIAGPNADKLKAEKYVIVGTGDLPPPAVEKSTVYYAGDFQAEAQAVAKVLGIADSQVAVMPATPPAALNGADILVVIGKDKG